jgi:hypothetical protein
MTPETFIARWQNNALTGYPDQTKTSRLEELADEAVRQRLRCAPVQLIGFKAHIDLTIAVSISVRLKTRSITKRITFRIINIATVSPV